MRPAVRDARAIEIAALFEESVLAVHHLVDTRERKDFTVGPSADATFTVASDVVPHGAFPLVHAAGGDYELTFTSSMSGDVTVGDAVIPLRSLVERGHARPSAHVPGAFAWPIVDGARCKVDLGFTTVLVSMVSAPIFVPAHVAFDWREQLSTACVAVATMLFLFMVFSLPPDPKTLALDAFMRDGRFARFIIAPPMEKPPEATVGATAAGTKGKAAAGASGKMGAVTAKATTGLASHHGPKNSKDPAMRKTLAEKAAADAGLLGVARSLQQSSVGSLFGRTDALGNEATDVLGGLVGTEIREAAGNSGLAVVGSGRGGNLGDGEGTIGTGKLGTIGRGGAGGSSGGYGRCSEMVGCGARGLTHVAAAPSITAGAGMGCNGCLDKEIIRRVVRQHLNEVKFCYEQELLKNPELDGRIAVQFTIGGAGTVLTSAVQSSTMHDPFVEQCVATAVKRWEFPKPQGLGLTTVSYPFGFKAAGG